MVYKYYLEDIFYSVVLPFFSIFYKPVSSTIYRHMYTGCHNKHDDMFPDISLHSFTTNDLQGQHHSFTVNHDTQ